MGLYLRSAHGSSPHSPVRQVLDYAVSEITPAKISMGIPNYGYDWPLPFVRGVTEAANIGNHEAIEIAALNNAAIQYDDISRRRFLSTPEMASGISFWFEDAKKHPG